MVSLGRKTISSDVTFGYTVHESAIEFNGDIDDNFGSSIAISGNWAAVGASTAETRTAITGGEVLIFKQTDDQWNLHSRLAPSTIANGDQFGSSIDLNDGVLVVGSQLADAGNQDAGAAYVFELSNDDWVWQGRLFAEGIDAGDQFGSSVSTDGERIVVGAIYDENGTVTDTGTATVFEKSDSRWVAVETLVADTPEAGTRFGHDVSIDGSSLAVSSPLADGSGKVFLYQQDQNEWQFADSLTATDTTSGDQFGGSISLQGDRLAVGASKHDHNGVWNTGAAYLFESSNGQWQQTQKLVGQANYGSVIARDQFGSSVDLDGNRVAVGAAFEDASGEDSGAVYLFDTDSGELAAKFAGQQESGLQGSQAVVSDGFVLSTGSDNSVAFQGTNGNSATVTLQR